MEFLKTIFSQPVFIYTIIVGFFASLLSGVIGTFVSLKNISYLSGGISHAVLGGIGIAYFFGQSEFLGALIFAVISAVLIGVIHFNFQEKENVLISALWAVGMAIGLIFMQLTPGYSSDLASYIFGSIILVSFSDVILTLILSLIIFTTVFIFYRQFISIAFDQEHSQLRQLKTKLLYILILILIAISIVILIRLTGIILLIALFTLPASTARLFSTQIPQIMLFAILFAFSSILLGFYLSYHFELPIGALIVLVVGGVYFGGLGVKKFVSV
jgi:zinc transport system permease protein